MLFLKSTSVEMSGGALGLSEAIYAIGIPCFEKMLPIFLSKVNAPESRIREGYKTY